MRNPVALLLAVVVAVVLAALSSPASAHTALVESDPAQGARLDAAPEQVTFSFNEDVGEPAYVVVTAAGERVAQGAPVVDGGTVSQAIEPDAPAGRWTMAFRVVSTDGHPVTGEVSFSVAGSTSSSSRPSPEPEARTGDPTSDPAGVGTGDQTSGAGQVGASEPAGAWSRYGGYVVGGAALLALAGIVLMLARRRRP